MSFDFHVHIARLPHAEELSQKLIARGYQAVIVACEKWEWDAVENLLSIWKEHATPCFGIHPMIASAEKENFPFLLQKLTALLEKYPQAFVGECGLDKRYPGYKPGEIQEEIFQRQAELALHFQRPLMIHSVGDTRRILKILEKLGFGENSPPIILHRFTGDAEIVQRALKFNALFSLHRDSFRKTSTREALPLIPEERIRFETDAC